MEREIEIKEMSHIRAPQGSLNRKPVSLNCVILPFSYPWN